MATLLQTKQYCHTRTGNLPVLNFRLIVLGDAGVGKTSLVHCLWRGKPCRYDYEATIGVEFTKIPISLSNGKKVNLDVWDTAGQETYRSLIDLYYRDKAGVVLVFDVCSRPSFESLSYWFKQIRKKTLNENVKVVLVGNKIDREETGMRKVSREEAEDLAEKEGILYMETSVKSNINVTEVFQRLGDEIYKAYSLPKRGNSINSRSITERSLPPGITFSKSPFSVDDHGCYCSVS